MSLSEEYLRVFLVRTGIALAQLQAIKEDKEFPDSNEDSPEAAIAVDISCAVDDLETVKMRISVQLAQFKDQEEPNAGF